MNKYSDEQITECVRDGFSFNDAHTRLTGGASGSSFMWFKKRVSELNLNTEHFDPPGKSTKPRNYKNRLDLFTVLVHDESLVNRVRTKYLVRGLLESGIPYRCAIPECGIDSWLGKPITLDVDHIDGNWRNNEISNLQFLCGNCHKQTSTYGYKKKSN